MIPSEHRNIEETEEGIVSALGKGCIQFLHIDGVSEDAIKTMLKVCDSLVNKGVILIL